MRLVVLAGLSLAVILMAGIASAHDAIPNEARIWQRTLIREVRYYWGMRQSPTVFAAQIHQESRWKEAARSRVGASGLTQFMPTTAQWIQQLYAADLKELCADRGGCPLDARWAIRSMILYMRRLYIQITDSQGDEQWAMALVSYNGGNGNLRKERSVCLQAGLARCDPAIWFGHIELFCVRAEWACRESREYPDLILHRWRPLYQRWLAR